MLNFKTLTLKNFMSVGQNAQSVYFDNNNLTLILGENLDTADDTNIGRNGVGKSCIWQGLSYGLFGIPLNNDIKKNNLVNNINEKNMFVIVEFEKDGHLYKIERGRKPNFLKFSVDNKEVESKDGGEDEAQGENKHTQEEIQRVLGFSHVLFRHIIVMNTLTEPFLSMSAKNQREFIEELLGINQLSEKAEILKKDTNEVKSEIKAEEIRLQAAKDNNTRIEKTIRDLNLKRDAWDKNNKIKINETENLLSELLGYDIDSEIENHKKLSDYKEAEKLLNSLVSEVQSKESLINKLNSIDASLEIENHTKLKDYLDASKNIKSLDSDISRITASISRHNTTLDKMKENLENAINKKCPTCLQGLHGGHHEDIVSNYKKELDELEKHISEYEEELNKCVINKDNYTKIINDIGQKPVVHYSDVNEAYGHMNKLSVAKAEMDALIQSLEDANKIIELLGDKPSVKYATLDEAYTHKNNISIYTSQLESYKKETNPYNEQIQSLKDSGIVDISYETINELVKLRDHQEFLYKLLTNKDSFIRKKIIDQNLAYLNLQLNKYLEKLGLPHEVKFINDLSVEITHLGKDLDFGNLSRGERTRLILGLSWAFRDIWEMLNYPINVLIVDECIDLGIDTQGVENAYSILKEKSRNNAKDIFVVSHREDLISKIGNILKVTKENGFTNVEKDTEYNR